MSNVNQILKKENTENVIPPKEEIKKEETVNIKKEDFEAMITRLERLEKTANKARLSNYDSANNKEEKETIIKLRTIDGKVIVKWEMIRNTAEVDPVTRKITEDQVTKVHYEDGTTEEMSIVVFDRRYNYIFTTLKEERILKDREKIEEMGNRILTLFDENGKEYNIGEKFVN